ncbi:MAG TPA: hypothetical protein DCL69_09155, partial [Firmicutes bacterium]|nr:hypothetical protein [Bacillota bacterium]
PGLNGKGVIEAMRTDPELMEIPVVLMTGAVPTLRDFPDDMNYQALISKPFDLQEVISIVHRLADFSTPVLVALEHCGSCI